MQRLLGGFNISADIFGGRLRTLLIISFSLIASITVSVGAVATSRTITDYLASAADAAIVQKAIVQPICCFLGLKTINSRQTTAYAALSCIMG